MDTQNGFGVSFTVTLGLSDEVGHDRVMDASIEENTIVGAAVVESVEKTKRALIVEEDNLTGGWGAELAARIGEALFQCLEHPVRRVAAPDTPLPCAPALEREYVPSVERIVDVAREMLKG